MKDFSAFLACFLILLPTLHIFINLSVWEISTGRCLRTFEMNDAIMHVAWNPSPKLFLLAVVLAKLVVFLSPENYLTDKIVVNQTNAIFKQEVDQGDYIG